MSTTCATAWVRDDPTMIQAPSVIFEGLCDSSRKPHGSPVSSSLFRSTGRSTVVGAVFSGIRDLCCAVDRANDLHPGSLSDRNVDRIPRLLPPCPGLGSTPNVGQVTR